MNNQTQYNKKVPIVAISIGDLSGIGPEVVIKSLEKREYLEFFTPVIFASTKTVSFFKKVTKSNVQFNGINKFEDIRPGMVNVFDVWKEAIVITPGKPTPESGKYALRSVDAAMKAISEGKADVLVTAPVDKNNIAPHAENFKGHTGYLEEKWGGSSLMFMISDGLRVALQTHHVPISEVSKMLTQKEIEQTINELEKSLRIDFGITKPRIAVLGLNPHAGDGGLLGKEEIEIIKPTVERVFNDGKMLVFGPYSADSFFQPKTLNNFDAVLAMYHDQGLVPFKTMSFSNGVNFTAGLPYVRTSPDHGVGYDIAGNGLANHASFLKAIFVAVEIFKNRKENLALSSNPLKSQKKKNQKKYSNLRE